MKFYSKRNQENLSIVFTCFKGDCNINLFMFSSKRESPYKSKVILFLLVIANGFYTIHKINAI